MRIMDMRRWRFASLASVRTLEDYSLAESSLAGLARIRDTVQLICALGVGSSMHPRCFATGRELEGPSSFVWRGCVMRARELTRDA